MAAEVAQLSITGAPRTPHSAWSMFCWRLRQNPKAMIGGAIVIFLLAVAIFAPLLAPKDPTDGELADSLASARSGLCARC